MGIFGFFSKEQTLSDADRKWNRMWDLWVEGSAESPYSELMEYESEVNNGGHSQYFLMWPTAAICRHQRKSC